MIRGSYSNILWDYHNHHNPTREILWTNRWQQVDLAGCRCRHLGSSRMFLRNLCTWSRSHWETMRNWYIPENSKCMDFFCRFRISAEFSDFALKNGFRRNSIIGDQFRRNWLLNVCPSKVRKHVGRFRRNCPQFRRNYLDSALVTNIHSPSQPIKTLFRQNWKLSAFFSVFGNFLRIRRFLCWNVISAEVRDNILIYTVLFYDNLMIIIW